jgi:hypothetical protein
MKVKYSVSFEFLNKPPLTHTGTVVATGVQTCFARAVKEAKQALRPVNWSSVVCVVLERIDKPQAETVEGQIGKTSPEVDT